MKKVKDPNRLRFKDYLGTTCMNAVEAMGAALMTSWFLQYLTDYAGIGKWGATLGATLLMLSSLFDAVNDPLEGMIMDRAKVGKHGKYKPFILLSIIFSAVGISCLFSLPEAIGDNPVLICVWVIFFYLLVDIGKSFYAPNLVYRTMTLNQDERGKLVIGPRMLSMIMGLVTGSLIAIVTGVNANIGNMHTAFSVTILVMMGISAVIALAGTLLVKEKYHAADESEEKIKFTDIFRVLQHNKAQRVVFISRIFSGFIWNFLFATMLYYVKWAYCADLTTGEVDAASYGTLSLIGSMMMFLPLIVGTMIATPLMKLTKSAIKLNALLKLVQGVVGAALFVLHIVGILPNSPILFFSLLAISATCIGIDYIPQEVVNIECMDYELYVGGRDRAALCNACNKFLDKVQGALSTGLVGVVLIAIGYQVDSATDTYVGELSAIPNLLTWFIVVMGLVPFFLGIISYVVLKKYPIDDKVRAEMREKVNAN